MYMNTFCMLIFYDWLIACLYAILSLNWNFLLNVLLLKEIQVCINLLLYQDLIISSIVNSLLYLLQCCSELTLYPYQHWTVQKNLFFGSLYPFLCAYILYIFVWSKGHWQPVSITFWVWLCNGFFCRPALSSLVDYQWGFKIVLKDVWMEINRNWFMPIFLCFKAINWKQKEVVMIKCS